MINNINLQKISKIGEQGNPSSAHRQIEKKDASDDKSLHLSQQGNIINELANSGEPQVDAAKLQALKAAIANGHYKIDYDKLAEALAS